jgi:hypothetical protein
MNSSVAWATFQSDLQATGHPKGENIAEVLRGRLGEAGLELTAVENWRDSGYSFIATIAHNQFEVVISNVDSLWLLCCSSSKGWLRRLLGRESSTDIRVVARRVDEALRSDRRFLEVRWYPDGWTGSSRDRWAEHP